MGTGVSAAPGGSAAGAPWGPRAPTKPAALARLGNEIQRQSLQICRDSLRSRVHRRRIPGVSFSHRYHGSLVLGAPHSTTRPPRCAARRRCVPRRSGNGPGIAHPDGGGRPRCPRQVSLVSPSYHITRLSHPDAGRCASGHHHPRTRRATSRTYPILLDRDALPSRGSRG